MAKINEYAHTCIKCGGIMNYKEGTKKETGKKWQGWFCTDKECKTVEWIKVPLTQLQELNEKPSLVKEFNKVVPPSAQIKEVKKEETYSGLTKKEWADKDAGIASLALCKVKAIAQGYNRDVDDIREDIYSDYIFFYNRITKEE